MDQTHEKRAVELFKTKGSNCSQAVLAVFERETGLDQDALLKIASPLGGGMGRLGGLCGALAGACIAHGLIKGTPYWAIRMKKKSIMPISEISLRNLKPKWRRPTAVIYRN
jgi:C_GCAxxG_C_C family probable redox protein